MVESFLAEAVAWARGVPGMAAVALVGSHARGEARPDSDVDLVLLTRRPAELLGGSGWMGRFGAVARHATEDWGRVVSLRVWYASGLEAEFAVTTPEWATRPDAGTLEVACHGLRALWDPQQLLAALASRSRSGGPRPALDVELRRQLVALRERDRRKRQELLERGELFAGYHPEMERVHAENAAALERVLARQGWPTARQAGEDGAEAAWRVAVHAIGRPAFQRRCRSLLEGAVSRGEARAAQHAVLVDRIRFNERRPQVYGTLLDWDEQGQLGPWPIEDAAGVDARRRAVGLPPLEASLREARARAEREEGRPPKPYPERQAEILAWARRVGWVTD